MPSSSAKPSGLPSSLSHIERILREGSTPSSSLVDQEQQGTSSSSSAAAPIAMSTTPMVRQAPMKSFVRRREPEMGKKTNKFSVDDDILILEDTEV